MTDTNQIPIEQLTIKRATILAVVCLLVGIAGGWSIRGWQHPEVTGATRATDALPLAGNGTNGASQLPDPVRLKEMADAQAGPLLDKLKSDPNNPDLLTSLGNFYYDAKQYPIAVDYYGRALQTKPSDVAVRTDMATAYWYMGNADSALAEFNKALTYAPNNPNTLFNRGLVKWQGKMDSAGAVADWEKLLATNPDYGGKDKVQQMMTEVKQRVAVRPEIKSK